MAVTKTYNRPKSTVVNSTAIDVTIKVSEKPDAPGAIGGTGTTGNLDARFQADADESGGTDIQDLFKLETTIAVDATTGQANLTVLVTPIKGGALDGTAKSMVVTHDETVDAWQTAAGRARQA